MVEERDRRLGGGVGGKMRMAESGWGWHGASAWVVAEVRA